MIDSPHPTSHRAISRRDYRALADLRFLIRQFLATSERMAQGRGLTLQQHQLLLAIEGRPPEAQPTIGYLAARLLIRHHSAVGLVDRLVEQGWVVRESSTDDRRQVLVRLTPRAEALLSD